MRRRATGKGRETRYPFVSTRRRLGATTLPPAGVNLERRPRNGRQNGPTWPPSRSRRSPSAYPYCLLDPTRSPTWPRRRPRGLPPRPAVSTCGTYSRRSTGSRMPRGRGQPQRRRRAPRRPRGRAPMWGLGPPTTTSPPLLFSSPLLIPLKIPPPGSPRRPLCRPGGARAVRSAVGGRGQPRRSAHTVARPRCRPSTGGTGETYPQ